jgi:hypothetical protein
MKFMPQKREKGLSRSVNFMKFLEREVFAISGFQLHNAKNLCLSYKIIQIKIG